MRVPISADGIDVSVAPSLGNIAYEMKANGRNVFWFPFRSLDEFIAKPEFCANPFLAPWANRLDHDGFWANGTHYQASGTLHDGNGLPIHGLLAFSPLWEVTAVEAHQTTSRLEFWRHPALMAQFPFAHTVEMTHRLQGGALEIATRIENHSRELMPVAVGFHPYLRLYDCPRDQWQVHLPAADSVVLSDRLLPTGERKPVSFPDRLPLAGHALDDVFTGLTGREFRVEGRHQRITVTFGPKYQVAIVHSPVGSEFICIEPMAALTNAFNLAHEGRYPELQSIPPDGVWEESFWIKPEGF